MQSPSSAFWAATSPPSPSANRFFVGWKLKVETMPCCAIAGEPNACAASSISGCPSEASSSSGAGRPKRWTGMIARVLGVIRAATSSGSRFNVCGSTSAKTGVAPRRATASAVAKNVNAGQITSSPGPMPIASITSTSASVPLATPIVSGTPRYAAASASNAAQLGPNTNCPWSSAPAKACWSSGISGAYCALTSTSGIFGTPGNGRGALPVPDGDNRQGDEDDQRDPDVCERVVERVVARSERPAACSEAEAEGGAADRCEREELRQRVTEEPGGDGDERANDRRREPERNGDTAEALEPALRSVHAFLRDVQPFAVTLEQRP